MFVVSKLVDHLLLPPGLFFLLIAVAFVLLLLKKRIAHRVLLIVSAALIYLMSTEIVRDALLIPLENRHEPFALTGSVEADYICVLGGGMQASSPDAGGSSVVARGTLRRLVYANRIADRFHMPIILSGGSAGRHRTAVAELMREAMIDFGIGEDRILVETQSRDTWENARVVAERYRPERVILVTSAYHMRRSVYSFAQHGIQTIPAPTDYLTNRGGYSYRSFLPKMESLFGVHTALREYVGLLYYRIRRKGR